MVLQQFIAVMRSLGILCVIFIIYDARTQNGKRAREFRSSNMFSSSDYFFASRPRRVNKTVARDIFPLIFSLSLEADIDLTFVLKRRNQGPSATCSLFTIDPVLPASLVSRDLKWVDRYTRT